MRPRGFIALISAVCISGALLVLVVAGSMAGFYARSGVLDAERHERSRAAADACAQVAMLRLAGDPAYTGPEVRVLNALDQCMVVSVDTTPTQKIIIVQATSSNVSVTTLRVVYATSTWSATSWLEI